MHKVTEDSRLSHYEVKSNKNSHRDEPVKAAGLNTKHQKKVERSLKFEEEDDYEGDFRQNSESSNKKRKYK